MADNGNYDYTTEQQKILYRQEMAKQLQSAKPQEGKMVSGWYVAPPKFDAWGAALQQGIGGYLGGLAQKDSQDLNTKDMAEYRKNLADYLNPNTDTAKQSMLDGAPNLKGNLDKLISDNQDFWNSGGSGIQNRQPPTPSNYSGGGVTGYPQGSSIDAPVATPVATPQAAVDPLQGAKPAGLAPKGGAVLAPAGLYDPSKPAQYQNASNPGAPLGRSIAALTPQQIESQARTGGATGSWGPDTPQMPGSYDVLGAAGNLLKKIPTLDVAQAFGNAGPQSGGATGGWAAGAPPAVPNDQVPAPVAPPVSAPVVAPQVPAQVAPQQAPVVAPVAPVAPPVQAPANGLDPRVAQYNPSEVDIANNGDQQQSLFAKSIAAQQAQAFDGLSRTRLGGPMAQALAAKQLENQLMGSNGRYKTTTIADPINGGFIQSTEDSRTGRVTNTPLSVGSGSKVLETKETPEGLVERTAQGWRPAVGADGQRIVTNASAADKRSNTEAGVKLDEAKSKNKIAVASFQSGFARLDRIDKLYDEVSTGPIAGQLPNFTAKRQELQGLLAQEAFAEVRDSVAGADASGGSPRFAQSEFKYLVNNGGLQMTTLPEAAHNITAQMRIRAQGMQKSIQDFGDSLSARTQANPVPGGGSAPPRGQTFNGPNAQAASALGLK